MRGATCGYSYQYGGSGGDNISLCQLLEINNTVEPPV